MIERKKSDNQKKTKKTKHREINYTTKKARERRQRTDSQTDAGRKQKEGRQTDTFERLQTDTQNNRPTTTSVRKYERFLDITFVV